MAKHECPNTTKDLETGKSTTRLVLNISREGEQKRMTYPKEEEED